MRLTIKNRAVAAAALAAASLLTFAWLLAGGTRATAQEDAGDGAPKLVVLGFDGADAEHTARWMDAGELPNLARLRRVGTFAPLRPTLPSQTPVSWSTFSTGLSPGRHGIFDFLKRDPESYQPSFASTGETREPFLWGEATPWILAAIVTLVLAGLLFLVLKLFKLRPAVAVGVGLAVGLLAGAATAMAAARLIPVDRPVVVNQQHGDTFWEVLGTAGHRARVMRVPVTFPPQPFEHGELLSGLGTPDLSLRIGKPFYFTSELFFKPRTGDFSLEVVELIDNQGTIPTEIKGPPNKFFPDEGGYLTIPMTLTVAEDRSHVTIEVSGSELSLEPDEWSDWVRIGFPVNPLLELHGIGRFKLLEITPEVRLYLSPIQFDPEKLPPILDLTTPRAFVDRLTDRFGLFKTMGWSIDTWSISDGTVGEEEFMEDVRFTVDKNKEMLYGLLEDRDWDVLVHYFEFTDRVQHMMYRFFDEEHPQYEAEKAERWGGTILEAYKEMDQIVGEAMRRMPDGAVLLVVSDHGFSSFRRGINYNTWLAKNGFMHLSGEDADRMNLEDLFDQGDFFVNVDWSRTQAYALGLGQIYINLAGREANGIVTAEEYPEVVRRIREELEAYVDPETGRRPVARVFTREEAYGEVFDPLVVPDLVPSNSEGYRVGWQDSLGGIGREIMEDNTEPWSGDHCSVYPPLVEGILFANVPLDVGPGPAPEAGADAAPGVGTAPGTGGEPDGAAFARMRDVMPTILDLYGIEAAPELEGRSLWIGDLPRPAPSRPGP